MKKLQKLNRNQMVKLLDAINREGIDNQFWAISSYKNSWNADEVFGGINLAEFEPEDYIVFEQGDYITVMYDNENQFPTFVENLGIVTSFPHYDYMIEEDLGVLIFKI